MDLFSYISDRNKVGGFVIDIKKAFLNVDALPQEGLSFLICVFFGETLSRNFSSNLKLCSRDRCRAAGERSQGRRRGHCGRRVL